MRSSAPASSANAGNLTKDEFDRIYRKADKVIKSETDTEQLARLWRVRISDARRYKQALVPRLLLPRIRCSRAGYVRVMVMRRDEGEPTSCFA